MRRLVPPLIVTAVILAVAVPTTCNRGAIARAKAEAARLTSQRDSLLSVVGERERQQAALTIQRQTHEAEITRLRDSAIALERRRAAAQLTVRQLRTVGALQDQLRAAFPELGASAWGLTTLPFDDGDTLGLEYLLVPAWFAETFVIDHANAASWRAQKDQLLAVDSLRLRVGALQDSITRLVAANAAAYQTGYQTAFTSYQDLSKRHIAELSKPRIGLGSALRLLGAMGLGVVVGRALP
ncbi:MAG: hypothetical protein HYT81_12025 [Gemmatimonadetes bacterium]|nr:hypothetical protein [Gemmatimonadota bacterium]